MDPEQQGENDFEMQERPGTPNGDVHRYSNPVNGVNGYAEYDGRQLDVAERRAREFPRRQVQMMAIGISILATLALIAQGSRLVSGYFFKAAGRYISGDLFPCYWRIS